MKGAEKKKKILQSAGECFARFGYEKTTMDDIGKLVGLNKASLYYYYKDKESLFTEVILMEAEEYMEALQCKVSEAVGCERRILTYITERLKYFQNVINLHSLSIETLRSVQPIFENLYEITLDKEVDFLRDQLEHCFVNGEIANCDAEKVSRSILTVSDAIKHKAVQSKDILPASSIDYSKIEEEVVYTVSLIMKGLMKR